MDKPQGASGSTEQQRQENEQALQNLDTDFIRVLEDLIDTLVANGTLRLTDLPAEALEKLSQRKRARARMRDALDLINDEEGLI